MSQNVKKTVLRMACGVIQNYSHINYDQFPPIQILPSPIQRKKLNTSLLFAIPHVIWQWFLYPWILFSSVAVDVPRTNAAMLRAAHQCGQI